MIKAVIFDYNGVVTTLGKFDSLVKSYAVVKKVNEKELEQIMREKWNLARVGKINSLNFWEAIAGYLGYETQQLRKEWLRHFSVRPGVVHLAASLKKKGYITALLTNEIKDWMDEAIAKDNLQRYFSPIVTSYDVGAAKPDRKMFDAVLQQIALPVSDCVYIDDQIKNTEPAKELGFKTILFTSEDQLKQELIKYGVSVNVESLVNVKRREV